MARILVIGGHGRVALLLEQLLAGRGDHVTGLIRSTDQAPDLEHAGAEPLVQDLTHLDTAGWARVEQGYDAVVWSAGAGGGPPARTFAIDQDSAIRAIDGAAQAGTRRFVMISYLGAGPDHGVPESDAFFAYAQAKAAADAHLRASDLDWTILGPGLLSDDPGTGRIHVVPHALGGGNPPAEAFELTAQAGAGGTSAAAGSESARAPHSVPRADVARALAAVLGAS